jgi:hypothetical protein
MRLKVISTVAMTRFPFWEKTLKKLPYFCDGICVEFDMEHGDRDVYKFLKHHGDRFFRGKLIKLRIAETSWKVGKWHESLLRMVDDLEPDIVLTQCHDETFETPFRKELRRFWKMPTKRAIMFEFKMVTDDGRQLPYVYPSLLHMRAFKWQPGLTYLPYQGRARIVQYVKKSFQYVSRTKINHWCMYTKKLQKEKEDWIRKRYDIQAVLGIP